MLLGNISKLYNTQGISTINAINIGRRIVQQKDINWSNLIRGKDALVQINTKIIIQAFTPIVKPNNIPSINGVENISSLSMKL